MKHLKLFFALFAMLALGVGNAWGAEYQLVKSSTDLVAGCHYVIGATYNGTTYFMATTSNTNNRKLTSATVTNEKVTLTSDIMTFTLGGSNNAWTFKTDNYAGTAGYLNATSTTGSNHLKIVATDDNYNKFTISVDANGVATITCNGKTSRHIMYLNGTTCFACYNNQTQATYVKPSLYKEVTSEPSTPAKTYDVTWMVNGEEWDTTEDVEENTQITTLPAEPTDKCAGKVFQGWTDKEITDGQKPAVLFKDKSPKITKDGTIFYAVFATVPAGGGTGGSITISSETENFPTAYGTANAFTEYTLEGYKFKIQQVYINGGKLQWRASGNKSGTGTMYNTQKFPANIASIVVVFDASDDHKNHTVKVGTTENPTSGTSISPSISSSTYTFDCSGGSYDYFVLTNGANAGYVSSITINYGSVATPSDYTTSCSGSTEPVVSLTDEQLKWSAASATALKGADNNVFPTLTNDLGLTVTYDSSNKNAATIAADGKITLVDPGTTTISAAFAGGEVNGTKYAAKTVTYTLTVKQLVSCADIYNLVDDATFVLKDFVVTYVNGDYTYIKDATGYGVIYKNSYGLQAGDQVASGKLEGKKDTYKGLVEIIPTTTAADLNATSGTAPEPEVMTNTPTNADINKYVKFENVSFKYTNLNDTYKTNSGKLEGQTEYNIAFYNKFTSNVTFDTSKKYDVVGVVSIKDDAIEVYFISAEEVAEPTLNVKITDADFGKIAINGKAERTLTLNGSLLKKPVSLAIEGDYFTLASNSVTPVDGKIEEEKIKITYKPTVEGTHTATLKITSDELAKQTIITLQGQAVQQHTVDFYVNKEKQTELAKKVLSGEKLTEIPTATSCDPLEYPTFIGWSASEITGTTDVEPTDLLDLNTTITADCKYYAVFAKATSSTTSTGITYEVTLKNTDFITKYDERTIDITANEVGGDGTVEVSFKSVGVMKCTDTSKGAVIQFRKKSSSSQPGIIYNTTDLGQINSITIGTGGTNNIASIVIGSTQQPTTQEDNEGFFLITNGNNVSYIPSITINFTQNSNASTTTYTYLTTCESATPTYTVTYNLDGGESTCETSVIVEQDGELTLCDAPTKTGHTFLNWKDQNDNEYAAGAKITVSEDLTLTAQWQVNLYEVTWMSLGSKLSSSDVNYNTQPTQPTTKPTYLCGTDKEFVGWTTQEIDGVGIPTNLYTTDFPVVTDAITYHAVFASKIEGGGSMSKAVSLTNGETVYLATESGIGVTGANVNEKDATVSSEQGDWMQFTVVTNGLQYQFKNGEKYITAGAKTFKITEDPSNFAFENGYIVYNVSSGADQGDYVLLYNSNSGSFYRFYKKSNIGKENYETFYVYKNPTHTDYVTSCEEVGSDMSNSTKVTPSVESGIFSVGAGKYVQFSTGNLQYEVGTNTWSFAEEQYEVIGGEAYDPANPTNTNYGMNVPGYTGKLDLFAWSCDGKFGVNPSNTDAHYGYAGSDFVDWGELVNETGWSTLTQNEMNYILGRKKGGKELWALATVNDLVGLILLPDNWDTNINLVYGYIPEKFVYTKNLLSIAEWQTLEEAGAVFLPAGGSRTGGYGNTDNAGGKGTIDANGHYFHVDNVNICGYYWLNTQDPRETHKNCASFLILPGWDEGPTVDEEGLDDLSTRPQVWSREKRRGNSVRLVKEVPAYTVSVTAENGTVTGAGTYPQGAEVTLTATAADGYKFTNWSNGETTNPYTFTIAADVNLTANFEVATVEPETYTRTVTSGNYGTICLPYASSSFTGAEFYEVSSLVVGEGLWLDQLADGAQLEAGKPYIFQATATEITVTYTGAAVANPVEGANGLTGTFTEIAANGDLVGNYIIAENKVWVAGTNATLPANRAYIANTVPTTPQAQIPGRRRICMGENQTTGLDNITNGENTTIKVIENGQLIIIRNGEKFNAQGQRL